MCLMPPGAPRGAPPHKRGLRRACCTAVGDVLANNSPIFSDDLAVCARPCVARPDVHPPRNGSVASCAAHASGQQRADTGGAAARLFWRACGGAAARSLSLVARPGTPAGAC